ncbi:MAG: DNA polymerase III subunit delta [Bacillota bacterium]|jgi:DNA polymerase-3 subunit delta|nr:DNA polymerase III subunit delta [Thermoanaerobacteraceae bacterium]
MRYFLDLLAELEKGEIAPVYLFYGPEVYLQREAVRRFREALVGEDALNYATLDGEEASPREVVEIADTLPLFSSRRLVVVKNAPYFTSGRQKEDPALIAYLRRPSAATCLIFCTAAAVDKRREVYKLVQAHGRTVEFTHLAPEDLKKWFQKRARQAGKVFEPGAADALLAAGRELTVLHNELEKVLAYTGDNPAITAADVAAVLTPTGEETVFAAVDAFGERRYPAALAKIRALLETEPAGVVLALLARQLRLIILAQDFLSAGGRSEALARELGVHPFVAKKVTAQARRFPRTEVEELFRSLLELDAAVKTGREEFLAGLERRLLLQGLKKTIPK